MVHRARNGLAAIAALLVTLSACTLDAPAPDVNFDVQPASMPTSASVTPADAEEFRSIVAGSAGTPMVVNVWATWCAPCRVEMPQLERSSVKHEGAVQFLGVSVDQAAAPAEEFLDDLGVSYPNVVDAGGVARLLEQTALPTTYFIDADGTIRGSVPGAIDEQRLEGAIQDLLR